jgi:germination protein M
VIARRMWQLTIPLLLVPLLCGCQPRPHREPPASPAAPSAGAHPTEGATVTVSLYFVPRDADRLVRVEESIPSGESVAVAALNRLIVGPRSDSRLIEVMPEGTKVLGITVESGTATVDLNSTFRDDFPEGSNIGYLCVYSIVHTLCDLPGIERVRFLIEGKPVDALGQVGLRQPLAPDPELTSGRP